MRVVLDPNVLVSALISPAGPPREILTAWTQGRFELIASPALLGELRDVLARAKFRRWASAATAAQYVDGLAGAALINDDPPAQPGLSPETTTSSRWPAPAPPTTWSPTTATSPASPTRPRPCSRHASSLTD